jgi:hypothetical protein
MRSAFTVNPGAAGTSYVGLRKWERLHRSGFLPISPRTVPVDSEFFSFSMCGTRSMFKRSRLCPWIEASRRQPSAVLECT